LRVYAKHYNEHRPHRALQLAPPNGGNPAAVDRTPHPSTVYRHDLLGGVIREYRHTA
jgi:putative transposase